MKFLFSLLLMSIGFGQAHAATKMQCVHYDPIHHGAVVQITEGDHPPYLLYSWKGSADVLKRAPDSFPKTIDIMALPATIHGYLLQATEGKLACQN